MTPNETVKGAAEASMESQIRDWLGDRFRRDEERRVVASRTLEAVDLRLYKTDRADWPVFIVLHSDVKRYWRFDNPHCAVVSDGALTFNGIPLLFTDDIGPTKFAFISKEQTFTACAPQ